MGAFSATAGSVDSSASHADTPFSQDEQDLHATIASFMQSYLVPERQQSLLSSCENIQGLEGLEEDSAGTAALQTGGLSVRAWPSPRYDDANTARPPLDHGTSPRSSGASGDDEEGSGAWRARAGLGRLPGSMLQGSFCDFLAREFGEDNMRLVGDIVADGGEEEILLQRVEAVLGEDDPELNTLLASLVKQDLGYLLD